MRRRVLLAGVAAAVAVLPAACSSEASGDPAIVVEGAVIPAPAGGNGALYLRIVNEGDGDDRLVEVRTDVAGSVELHETVAGDDGLARMVPVDEIEVGAGATVAFAPAGLHVMLIDVDRLEEGDVVAVELEFATSGVVEVEAEVGTVADALG